MTLRPLRDLDTDATTPEERIAVGLAKTFPSQASTMIPPARATARSGARGYLRPAFAALLLLCAAGASAMLVHRSHVAEVKTPALPAPRERAPIVAPPREAPILVEPAAPSEPPRLVRPKAKAVLVEPAVAPSPIESIEQPVVPEPAAPTVTAPTAADFALLAEAMRTLRTSHDPHGADALARQYLDKHPTGELVEEAFAIRVEAAVAAHASDARALAEQYLSRWPTGRYADVARRTTMP